MDGWSSGQFRLWITTLTEASAPTEINWWLGVRIMPQSRAYDRTLPPDIRREWAMVFLLLVEGSERFAGLDRWTAATDAAHMRALLINEFGPLPGDETCDPAALVPQRPRDDDSASPSGRRVGSSMDRAASRGHFAASAPQEPSRSTGNSNRPGTRRIRPRYRPSMAGRSAEHAMKWMALSGAPLSPRWARKVVRGGLEPPNFRFQSTVVLGACAGQGGVRGTGVPLTPPFRS